jgi:hypothetical protein
VRGEQATGVGGVGEQGDGAARVAVEDLDGGGAGEQGGPRGHGPTITAPPGPTQDRSFAHR